MRRSRSQRGMAAKNTKRRKKEFGVIDSGRDADVPGDGRIIDSRMIIGNEVPQAFLPEVLKCGFG